MAKKKDDTPDPSVNMAHKPQFEEALEFAQAQAPAAPIAPEPVAAPPASEGGDQAASESAPPSTPAAQAWGFMPESSEAAQILRRRAELLARVDDTSGEMMLEPYIRFRLGPSELYGVVHSCLEEVIPLANVAHVPCTPSWVAGVTNYRGELLTVLDPKQFLHTDKGELGEHACILVLRVGRIRAGLSVDEVEGEGKYALSDLAPPLASAGVSNPDYIQGIHDGRITILNINALLADTALQVDTAG